MTDEEFKAKRERLEKVGPAHDEYIRLMRELTQEIQRRRAVELNLKPNRPPRSQQEPAASQAERGPA